MNITKATKMKISIKSFLSLFLILNFFSYSIAADIAGILPLAKTQFLDQNGKPLTSGTVDFYIPGTFTRKNTWQDAAEAVPNTNPVVLDAAGRALIWGFGSYRQIVKDRNANTIWDQVTASAGSGSGGGGSTIGDGNLVGTILPWSGLIAPPNYAFAYGQEIARLTYPEYLAAITSVQAVFCTLGSPVLSGVGDTTQIPIGADIEASCVASGSTVLSKTSSTLTVSNNANASTNVVATIFPWGGGNHTTTFNVPDYRGRVLAGRDNMGSVAANRLTTSANGFGVNASAIGAAGGNESETLTTAQMPSHQHDVFLNDPGHQHSVTGPLAGVASGVGGGSNLLGGTSSFATSLNVTGLQVRSATGGGGTQNITAAQGGGTAHTIVQPTITLNYIVKITPDVSASTAVGVASISGMTGVLVCGSGLTCASNTISVVVGGGAVTSVGLALPASVFNISGSPVTGVGTLTGTFANQTQQTFFAGPIIGAATTPAFRTITLIDLPLITNGALSTVGAATIKGNPTASAGASVVDFTIQGLTARGAPDAANDKLVIYDNSAGTLKYVTPAQVAAAATAGVSSIAGNTGAFTLGTGLTNAVNDIQCVNGSSSVKGCVQVDNTTITASSGVISTVNPLPAPIRNVLSGDVALSSTASFFDGPSIAQGATGTWFVSGSVTIQEPSAADQIICKLWDGTTVIAAGEMFVAAPTANGVMSLSGYLATPAGNLKISCRPISQTTGKIVFNITGTSKDSLISAFRIQ